MARAPYNEFAEKWKSKIEVDYFTEFIKTWISFNAWYKMSYPTLNTDRQAIDEIKNNSNTFRNRIVALLAPVNDDENLRFKNHIGVLHRELERKHILNKENRISFEAVVVSNNPTRTINEARYGIDYRIVCNYSGGNIANIELELLSQGNSFFRHTQTNYDFREIGLVRGYDDLSEPQKRTLEIFYRDVRPKLTENLLKNDPPNIQLGQYYFTDDTIFLAKGLIEILYLIRNSLFHGTIVPDRETNRIYEQAYQILKLIVQEL